MDNKLIKLLAILGAIGVPVTTMAQQGGDGMVAENPIAENLVSESLADEISIINDAENAIVSAPVKPRGQYRYHNTSSGKARLYVQTEATFLSRQYEQAESSFNLLNSAEFVPGGNYTNHVVSPADDRLVGLDWINIPVPALTSELETADQTADMMTGSPRISLGVVGSGGWGLQGRYWRIENSVGAFGPLVNLNPADSEAWRRGALSMTADFERFQAQTADLELTRDLDIGRWSGVATIGARYAEIRNTRNNNVDGSLRTGTPGLTTVDDALLNSFHTADYDFTSLQGLDFNGTGPTFSLSGIRPLNNNFSLFTSARGSVLFGESRNYASVDGQMSSLFHDGFSSDMAEQLSTEPLYIAELQLGAQWSRQSRLMNGRFFARGAFEYQFWRHSANQAQAALDPTQLGDYGHDHIILRPLNNLGQPRGEIQSGTGTTRGFASASGLESDFDMLGFSVTAGFVW